MTIERYFQWMRIWKWFADAESSIQLEALRILLDTLWREDCDKTSPLKLQEFGAAWVLEERHSK
jgi:hypothetical protein